MNILRSAPLVLGLVLLTGCGPQPSQKTVIFSQCNNAEPYRAAQNALLQQLCAEREEIRLVITDGQADANRQISQIETAIRQKPDLLIVAPLEQEPLTPVMGKAIEAGLPVICLERDIIEPNYTTYIRCDNRAIGRMAGEWIVEHLTAKKGSPMGNVVELKGSQGVEGAINRHEGAHEILNQHPEIKVIHSAVANWFQPEAMDRMAEALNAHPRGAIDVVYAHNDPMAYGAYLAAKEKEREKEIAFVGVDGLDTEGRKYVEDGVLGVTFEYPLCVDKAFEVGLRILNDPNFEPETTYTLESEKIDNQ